MSRCLNLLAFLYLHLHVTIILDIHSLLQPSRSEAYVV
jgi:hypothetical protein